MDKTKKFCGSILRLRCASLAFLLKDGGEPEAFRWLLVSLWVECSFHLLRPPAWHTARG